MNYESNLSIYKAKIFNDQKKESTYTHIPAAAVGSEIMHK